VEPDEPRLDGEQPLRVPGHGTEAATFIGPVGTGPPGGVITGIGITETGTETGG